MRSKGLSRRSLCLSAGFLPLAACGRETRPSSKPPPSAQAGTPLGTLAWAVAGPWRSAADRQRDKALHPAETLAFFGLGPGATVVEIWPGSGWWTQILAPYLKANKGKLYAATFEVPTIDDPAATPVVAAYRKMIADKPDIYGDTTVTSFGPSSGPLAPAGTADLALFFNLDSWMAAGLADKAFHDAFAALKRGGVLGLVQARGDAGGPQDPLAANGRVQEAFVRQMAEEAGFVFDKSSDINAAAAGGAEDAGEPDRMTLRFVKKAA